LGGRCAAVGRGRLARWPARDRGAGPVGPVAGVETARRAVSTAPHGANVVTGAPGGAVAGRV
ncbi:MAG: hypothetical protein SNJ69_06080, partial [Chloroflexaceae bacterium]